MFGLYHTDSKSNKAIWIPLNIESKEISFQLDTGASATVIPVTVYNELFSSYKLDPTNTSLRNYTGDKVHILGQLSMNIQYNDQYHELPLIVVDSPGPPLLGRNWLHKIKLD